MIELDQRVAEFYSENFGLVINFVVQKQNYREMPRFVELGEAWNVDRINFQRLWNFGGYEGDELAENDVAEPSHALHEDFLNVLADPWLARPIASLMNIPKATI